MEQKKVISLIHREEPVQRYAAYESLYACSQKWKSNVIRRPIRNRCVCCRLNFTERSVGKTYRKQVGCHICNKYIARAAECLARRLPSAESRAVWFDLQRRYRALRLTKWESSWPELTASWFDRPHELWSAFDRVLCRGRVGQHPGTTAAPFHTFFDHKVEVIRDATIATHGAAMPTFVNCSRDVRLLSQFLQPMLLSSFGFFRIRISRLTVGRLNQWNNMFCWVVAISVPPDQQLVDLWHRTANFQLGTRHITA